jgi:hypothetical protein
VTARTALVHSSAGKRDLMLSQAAFYSGACGVLKVLDFPRALLSL